MSNLYTKFKLKINHVTVPKGSRVSVLYFDTDGDYIKVRVESCGVNTFGNNFNEVVVITPQMFSQVVKELQDE